MWVSSKRVGTAILAAGLFAAVSFGEVRQAFAENVGELVGKEAITWQGSVVDVARLQPYYSETLGEAIWTRSQGLSENGIALVELLYQADADGLDVADYTSLLPANMEQLSGEDLAALELHLSDVFLKFARDLHGGRTTPAVTEPDIVIARKPVDVSGWLTQARDQGPAATLQSLRPRHPQYAQLRQMLAGYRGLAARGGWPLITEGPTLKPGMDDPRIIELRANMTARGYGGLDSGAPQYYDDAIVEVVTHFQKRNGLTADGIAGPATIRALNITAEERVQQIILNMERWRWLPTDLGQQHVFVNQAAFTMMMRNGEQVTDERKVVIGKPFHKTPIFSDRIKYAEFNPTWTVPPSIAGRAILPKLRENPGYLEANNYRLYTSWKGDAPAMSPYSIDWSSINPKRFPYRIVQAPGENNALGLVKFMFPNKFAVYLHDTSNRELFGRTQRAYSSGCIRVHRPLEFAEKLFSAAGGANRAQIDNIIASGQTKRVNLGNSMPVHLAYFTVWVNDNGVPSFYEDIYERDRLIGDLLFGRS